LRLNGKHIAVDWDGFTVRLLEFSRDRSGKVLVHRAVSVPAESSGAEDPEVAGAFLKSALAQHQIRASNLVVGVGRDRAFLHTLTIPASPEDQVANLVRFQLAQELPFAIEESAVDYVITARDESGKVTGVLAAAVKTETMTFFQHLARSAGLSLKRVGLRPHVNFLAAQGVGVLDGRTILLVDLSLRGLEIDIISGTRGVIFSRYLGLEDGATGTGLTREAYLEKATLQIKRTLQAQNYLAGGQSGDRPERLLVAGSTGWEHDLSAAASTELSLPATVFGLPDSTGPATSAFSACFGLACGVFKPPSDQLDFLNPKRAVDPQAVRSRQVRMAVGALAVLMLFGFLLSHHIVNSREKEYQSLVNKKNQLEKDAKALQKFSNQMAAIQRWQDRKMNWLDQLNGLTVLLPDNEKTYLTQIVLSETKTDVRAVIELQGLAKSQEEIDRLALTLAEKGKYKVSLGSQTNLQGGGDYPADYKLNLTLESKPESPATQPAMAPVEMPNVSKAPDVLKPSPTISKPPTASKPPGGSRPPNGIKPPNVSRPRPTIRPATRRVRP